jgi:hypothetical protein
VKATETRTCLLDRFARPQPEHDAEPPRRSVIQCRFGAANERLRSNRDDHVDRAADVGAEEVLRHHTDDRQRDALDLNASADHVLGAAEPALPERMTDHRHRSCRSSTPGIVRLDDRPAADRGHAEDLEHAAADPRARHELGLATFGKVEAAGAPGKSAIADLVFVRAQRFPNWIGPVAALEDREPGRIAHRQRFEHETVEDGKQRRVGADPQAQRQD